MNNFKSELINNSIANNELPSSFFILVEKSDINKLIPQNNIITFNDEYTQLNLYDPIIYNVDNNNRINNWINRENPNKNIKTLINYNDNSFKKLFNVVWESENQNPNNFRYTYLKTYINLLRTDDDEDYIIYNNFYKEFIVKGWKNIENDYNFFKSKPNNYIFDKPPKLVRQALFNPFNIFNEETLRYENKRNDKLNSIKISMIFPGNIFILFPSNKIDFINDGGSCIINDVDIKDYNMYDTNIKMNISHFSTTTPTTASIENMKLIKPLLSKKIIVQNDIGIFKDNKILAIAGFIQKPFTINEENYVSVNISNNNINNGYLFFKLKIKQPIKQSDNESTLKKFKFMIESKNKNNKFDIYFGNELDFQKFGLN